MTPNKHRGKGGLLLMFLFILLLLPVRKTLAQVSPEDSSRFQISTGLFFYRSYSQQKTGMPMRSGYPVLKTRTAMVGLSYRKRNERATHLLSGQATVPAAMGADNGTGRNLLVQKAGSRYFNLNLDYRLTWPLLKTGAFEIRHGMTSGLFFENRHLAYQGSASEETRDWNIYLGPSLQSGYRISKNWKISGEFDARIYLPFLNYGLLQKRNPDGQLFFESPYHSFFYQTLFRILLNYKRVSLGVEKNDLVGFASREPDFGTEGMLHHKLDRHFCIQIAVAL